jgi:hypothetical protein
MPTGMGLNPSLFGGPERAAHPAKGAMTEEKETTAPLFRNVLLEVSITS